MPEQKDMSYKNCVNRLHAQYDNRGVSASAAREAREQLDRSNTPNAYFVSRMNKNRLPEQYRNGEYNGQKYMTTGDFLKYYSNRKSEYAPRVQKSETAPTKEFKKAPQVVDRNGNTSEMRVAAPAERSNETRAFKTIKKFDPKADTIVLPAKKQTGIKGKIAAAISKWFPPEDRKEKTTTFKRDVPVAVIGLMVALGIAMTMIISSGVMASEASTQVSQLKNDITYLESECGQLGEELDKKENLSEMKAYAEMKLGMISKDYAGAEYLELGEGNGVTDNTDKNNGGSVELGTLLNAIFGE